MTEYAFRLPLPQAAVELMQSSLGCQFQPPLVVDPNAVCETCTIEIWRGQWCPFDSRARAVAHLFAAIPQFRSRQDVPSESEKASRHLQRPQQRRDGSVLLRDVQDLA